MSNILEYTLNLKGNLDAKLLKIGINNEKQLEVWAKVERQVNSANNTMSKMGRSIGSMNERIAALRAQKEWIPSSNLEAIRATNREIKSLENEINKLEKLNGGRLSKWFNELKTSIPGLNMITNPLVMAGAATYKLTQYIGQSKQAYLEESVQVAKLSQVMGNTMQARENEIKSILDLASAQQKLGVIGDETQLAGAQELATYLTKSESLKKLMPAMNDMLAQQYGLNATQEQAVNIASMLGKVMDGQTGALSRYGYKFDEAQEKILKTGTEAERAAVLFDVVNSAVGGVNEQLAKTPEGALKQQANNLGDLQERVGKLYVMIEDTLMPVTAAVGEFFDKVISYFESGQDKIQKTISVIANVITSVFKGLWRGIKWVWNVFDGFLSGVRDGNPIMLGLATVITAVTAALVIFKAAQMASAAWAAIIVLWNNLQTASWWKLNAAMSANPIVWIVAGVIALVALITYLIVKLDGWRETWENLMSYLDLSWKMFKSSFELAWLQTQDTFLSGIELIKKAWYQLQALWDKEGAKAGLAKIENRQFERASEIAAARGKMAELTKQRDAIKVFQLKWNDTQLSDVVGGLKNSLGITSPSIPGANIDGGEDPAKDDNAISSTSNGIASGGTRNTEIHITLRNLVENISFSGGVGESVDEMKQRVEQAMLQVLNMAYATA